MPGARRRRHNPAPKSTGVALGERGPSARRRTERAIRRGGRPQSARRVPPEGTPRRTAIAEAILSYLAGDWAEAETILSEALRELEQAGENGYRSTVLAMLAMTLCAQERYSEAETLTTESAAITAPDDAVSRALLHATRALLAARKGQTDTMQLEAEQAAKISENTDFLINRGYIFTLIARANQEAGDPRRTHEAATRALTSYQDKGVAAGIANTTALLAELREPRAQTKPR